MQLDIKRRTRALQVHDIYLKALADVGIEEKDVYGGARVHDKL